MIVDYNSLAQIKVSLKPLVGNGLTLRLLKEPDLPVTLAWRNREDIRHQFIHSDIITWNNHLSWWQKYKEKSDDFVFIIEDTAQLKRSVGQISLYNIDLNKSEAEYGRLMIGEFDARRKGLAKSATSVLISWAFNSLKLKMVYLNVLQSNTAAINLYKQIGFIVSDKHDGLFVLQIKNNALGKSIK